MQEVLDQLIEARALIADKEHWCSGRYVMGGAIERYCALGAIRRITGVHERDLKAVRVLEIVSEYYFGMPMVMVNDWHRDRLIGASYPEDAAHPLGHSHSNVLFCYDQAIIRVRVIMEKLGTPDRARELVPA